LHESKGRLRIVSLLCFAAARLSLLDIGDAMLIGGWARERQLIRRHPFRVLEGERGLKDGQEHLEHQIRRRWARRQLLSGADIDTAQSGRKQASKQTDGDCDSDWGEHDARRPRIVAVLYSNRLRCKCLTLHSLDLHLSS